MQDLFERLAQSKFRMRFQLKEADFAYIREKGMDAIHSLYVRNPDKDFTRNRKILFTDICWFLIGLQGKSMPNKVLDFFDHSISAPSSSAFIQQRKNAKSQSQPQTEPQSSDMDTLMRLLGKPETAGLLKQLVKAMEK